MRNEIDTSDWKEFMIGELFDISKGYRLTKSDMIPGETNFIGSSSVNNGITGHIGNTEHVSGGGVLTVCYNGSVGTAFYQESQFWASDDVNILKPRQSVKKESLLFVGSIIRTLGQEYNWTDKWTSAVMNKTPILLPIDSDNGPDWGYMDSYIENIMGEEQKWINTLINL